MKHLESLDEVLAILDTPGVIGVDFETTIARTVEREVCTFQVAHEDGRAAVAHIYDDLDAQDRLAQAITASPGVMAAHFAIFEAECFQLMGRACFPQRLVCTYIAARVLRGEIRGDDTDPRFSLDALMQRELGIEVDKSHQGIDWRAPLTEDSARYCILDAEYARDLWMLYETEFEADPGSWRGFTVVNDALRGIARCNMNGLRFNRQAHARLCASIDEELEQLERDLSAACDNRIENHGSAQQVGAWIAWEVCGREEGATPVKASWVYGQDTMTKPWQLTASRKLSLDKNYVGSIVEDVEAIYPEIGRYLRLRMKYQKASKLVQAFGPKLRDAVDHDGRLRGSLIPHGARTSRQSCRNPNLQQMPSEDRFRSLFEAVEGRVIVQADYSQIELRVGAIVCSDLVMQAVFRDNIDIHTATACAIAGILVADYDKNNPNHVKLRKDGKPVTFAALYGAEANTIALNSGLPLDEAKALLDTWLGVYQGVDEYRRTQPKQAAEKGYVELVSGQRIAVTETSRPAQLINAPVQGSAASVMYLAVTRVDAALEASGLDAKLALNVHDEILLDAAVEDAVAAGEILQEEMTAALLDLYPQAADMGIANVASAVIIPNWGVKDDPKYGLHLDWLKEAA